MFRDSSPTRGWQSVRWRALRNLERLDRGAKYDPDNPESAGPGQVFNANRPTVNLTPVSELPALRVRAGWAPTTIGQEIPMLGERRRD